MSERPFDNAMLFGQELCYSTAMIELMTMCWEQKPQNRPSAKRIIDIASVPEFVRLKEVVRSVSTHHVTSSCILSKRQQIDMSSSVLGIVICCIILA